MPVACDVVFTQAARLELIEAQEWYEAEAPGLGRQFRSEVDRAVERVREAPVQFPVIYAKARRALLRRFPYALFFTFEDETVFVVACFHGSRDPMRWQERI